MFWYSDLPESNQYWIQDPASSIIESILILHDDIIVYLVLVITFVFWILGISIYRYTQKLISHIYFVHGTLLEIIWTILPAIVLIWIALPSFRLLYLTDEIINPQITIKAVGHQWYWSYEYGDFITNEQESLSFDSYIIPTEDLKEGQLRLLEVDNRLILPVDTPIRILVTASDVLHSWTIPAFGTKIDAVPGRLNQSGFSINRPGLFYGQCSELCGIGHAFIPIVVEAVSLDKFFLWIWSQLDSDLTN